MGNNVEHFEQMEHLIVSDIASYKYARLTSCDVECTFSRYKSLFSDNRHSFKMPNLTSTFVVYYNSSTLAD